MCATPDRPDAAEPAAPRRIPRAHVAALAAGVAVYTLVFSGLAARRYRSFYAYEYTDLAGANQMMWRTVHAPGRPFFQTVTEQYFMGHFQPLLALLCLPYAAAPRPETLFFFIALAAALGALPVYALARRLLSPGAGIAWAFAYLLYSPLHNVTLTDFRPVVLAVPALLALLYEFERGRLRRFLFWCAVTLSVQESLGLWIAFMGPYALWRRRNWKWAAAPAALGVGWFVLCTRLIMPWTFRDVIYPFGGYLYLWIGNESAGALVRQMLFNPLCYARLALSPSRVLLLFKTFWPVAFLPAAAPAALVVPAATWFQLLMLHHSAIHANHIHWLAPIIPVVFYAAVLAAARVERLLPRGRRLGRAALTALPLAACAASNFGPNVLAQQSGVRPIYRPDLAYVSNLYDPVLYREDAEDRLAWRAVSLIPADAAVTASADLMPALSGRRVLYEFDFKLEYLDGRTRDELDVDYVAIHARSEAFGAGVYAWRGVVNVRRRALRLLSAGCWEPVFAEGRFLVLRRVRRADPAAVARAERVVRENWSDARALQTPGGCMDLARAAYEEGEVETAVRRYRRAAALSPRDPYPRRKAGQILLDLGRVQEAVHWLREAAARAPLCMRTHLDLADALLTARRVDEAAREYETAAALLPTDSAPYYGLGLARLAQDRRDDALRAFRRALRLNPSCGPARRMLERLARGSGAPDG